jgi:nucleoside-diphosphate-sugar epimerase
MKNVIIAGATGMVGGLVLQECLHNPDIHKVTIIVRRSTGIANTKLMEVIHNDFTDYASIEEHFKNQDIAYYCIGVYTGTVSRDEFRKITVDYTKAFAEVLKKHSPGATFCFLSGEGADQTETSRVTFAKDKGIAENFLIGQNFGQTYIFRPAYIYPSTPRREPDVSYRIMRALYPIFKTIYPNGVITSDDLARAMLITGLNGGNKTIIENRNIKEKGGKFE